MLDGKTRWSRSRRLMLTCLMLWACLTVLVPLLTNPLNALSFLGFPLGYYMAAQGSTLALIGLIFWFASRQSSIDRMVHVARDR